MSTTDLSMEVFEENVEKTEMQKRIISWKAEAALFCDKKTEIVEYVKSFSFYFYGIWRVRK